MLAVVSEPSPEVIDAAMATLGGTVLRRSVYDVEAEVAAVEKARQEVLRSKRDHTREAAHARVEELKAKVHRTETPKADA